MTAKVAEKRGEVVEDLVGEMTSGVMIQDFVHVRPMSTRPNGRTRELSDLLITLNRRAIIIQIKAQGTDHSPRREYRWYLKSGDKASRQASGADRALNYAEITAENPVRGEVTWGPGELDASHTLVLIEINSNPLHLPDDFPMTTKQDTPIHYFEIRDFLYLMRLLKTIPDLEDYLDKRARLDIVGLPEVGAERDLYAHYLLGGEFNGYTTQMSWTGAWDYLTGPASEEFQRKIEIDRYCSVINNIIETCHDLDPNLSRKVTPDGEKGVDESEEQEIYYRVASVLNGLPLAKRRVLGKRILDRLESSRDLNHPRWFIYHEPASDMVIAFVVGDMDRSERFNLLQNVLAAGQSKMGTTEGIGVAMGGDPNQEPGHGFEFARVRQPTGAPMLSQEDADKLLTEEKMVTDTDVFEGGPSEEG